MTSNGAPADPPILRSLNEAQRRAVTSISPTVAILAGPGSGKTHTLTSRVVWLLDVAGYSPQNVIVATFTVKAAREMKTRLGKALGDGRETKLVLGTFHSIARRYLAAYGKRIGVPQAFAIADDSDSRGILTRICKRHRLSVDPAMARSWISKKKAKGTEEQAMPKKGQNDQQQEVARDLQLCFDEYQAHLRRSNLLDYDDLLVKCVELLQRFPSCVSNVQAVLIDEYQDTNGVQYELMRLFAHRQRRITVVGDPDQSIYGWRSAEIRNLYRLLRDYPGTDEVSLEKNYRSSQLILDISLKVIQQDQKRYKKVLLPVHSRGSRPVLRMLRSAAKEAEWIVSEIRRSLMLAGGMMNHDDVAILLRSAALSRHIEAELGKSGVAYRMVGGFKFYDRAEIKLILDYLRVVYQPDNNDALARVINVPRRGIGDGTVKSWLEEAETASVSLWKLVDQFCRGDRKVKANITKPAEQKLSRELVRMVKEMRKRLGQIAPGSPFTLVELIKELLTHVKFADYLRASYPEEHEARWANVQEFVGLAVDFTRDLDRTEENLPEIEGVEQRKEDDVLAQFLANVSLASDVQKNDGSEESKPQVTISTIHAAKGLEWPIVFVPSAYNGSIPHMRSEDGDEERRLLYVAMTRAKALLYLSCPLYTSHGNGEKLELSPFLSPISGDFAKQGPSLQHYHLKDLGGILGRAVPSNEEVWKSMPLHFPQEDDLFPVDPEFKDKPEEAAAVGGGARDGRRPKRPRLNGPTGHGDEEGEMWHRKYATTMDQESNFTMSSLPGFVSAGVHHSAVLAAAKGPPPPSRTANNATNSKRRPDQKSLLGFFHGKPTSAPQTSGPRASLPQVGNPGPHHGRQLSRPGGVDAAGSIRPTPQPPPQLPTTTATVTATGCLSHTLGHPRSKAVPSFGRRHENNGGKRNHYAQFSSSPSGPDGGGRAEHISANVSDDENSEARPEPMQAAITTHMTTCTMSRGLQGFKRPAAPDRSGIAPIDRLRKPFKPLTMNRP